MYERGVRPTSIDDVLAAAGAGKSQFYHYFDSRLELLGAVVEHQLETVLASLDECPIHTWHGIRTWFELLLARQRERGFRGCPVGALVAEMTDEGDDLRTRVDSAFGRWQDVLARAFATMVAHGELDSAADPDELAQVVLAQIQGGYLLSSARGDLRPMEASLEAAYAHLRGFATGST